MGRIQERREDNQRARRNGVVEVLIRVNGIEESQKGVNNVRSGYLQLQSAFRSEYSFVRTDGQTKTILLEELFALTTAAAPRGFLRTRDAGPINIPDVDELVKNADPAGDNLLADDRVQIAARIVPGEYTQLTIIPREEVVRNRVVGAPPLYRKLTYFPKRNEVYADFGGEDKTYIYELDRNTRDITSIKKLSDKDLILLPKQDRPSYILSLIDNRRLRRL